MAFKMFKNLKHTLFGLNVIFRLMKCGNASHRQLYTGQETFLNAAYPYKVVMNTIRNFESMKKPLV